jgi:hypothetical protein
VASNLKLGTLARNAACTAVASQLDAGAGAGFLRVFDDADGAGAPASPQTADTAAQLTQHAFSDPAFGSPASGVATANAITTATIEVGAVAFYFRGYSSTGTCVFQGLVGEAAEAPNDLQLNNKTLPLDGTLAIDSMVLTVAEQ